MMEIKCYKSTVIALHFISFQPGGRLVQGQVFRSRFVESRFGKGPNCPASLQINGSARPRSIMSAPQMTRSKVLPTQFRY